MDWGSSEFGSDFKKKIFTEVENCWRREDIKGGDVIAKCRRRSSEKSTMKGKGTAAGNSRSSRRQEGRSTGTVDRRAQHAQDLGSRPSRSTEVPDCRNPTLRFSGSTGPVDRNILSVKTPLSGFLGRPSRSTGIRRSVDRPGRPTIGFWVKSADPLYEVFNPNGDSRVKISAKKY